MQNLLLNNIDHAAAAIAALKSLAPAVDSAARLVSTALLRGGKLLACGNGGSAADAAHLTTEFVCRFDRDRQPYPAICLASQGGDLTAIGNDYTFDDIFARQVQAFGRPGDVLLVFTTSGNSENIRRALLAAKTLDVHTIAFLGKTGGRCQGLAEVELLVRNEVTARIQECHKLLLHTLCECVERDLAASAPSIHGN